jgi:hypothetical protein
MVCMGQGRGKVRGEFVADIVADIVHFSGTLTLDDGLLDSGLGVAWEGWTAGLLASRRRKRTARHAKRDTF